MMKINQVADLMGVANDISKEEKILQLIPSVPECFFLASTLPFAPLENKRSDNSSYDNTEKEKEKTCVECLD